MARTDSITDDLRREILDGVFAPGERLVELSLGDRYDVGRATVRAALADLASEGLVEREANRGATVRRITLAEAIQITEARAVLERLIAAHAARSASDAEREELRQIEVDMRDAVARGASLEYPSLNALLHRRLREISGHTIAGHLVANLRNRAAHHQYRLSLMPGRPEESVEEHSRIIVAVVAADETAAADAMEAHLASVIDGLSHWADVGAPA